MSLGTFRRLVAPCQKGFGNRAKAETLCLLVSEDQLVSPQKQLALSKGGSRGGHIDGIERPRLCPLAPRHHIHISIIPTRSPTCKDKSLSRPFLCRCIPLSLTHSIVICFLYPTTMTQLQWQPWLLPYSSSPPLCASSTASRPLHLLLQAPLQLGMLAIFVNFC